MICIILVAMLKTKGSLRMHRYRQEENNSLFRMNLLIAFLHGNKYVCHVDMTAARWLESSIFDDEFISFCSNASLNSANTEDSHCTLS
jgi:hypothetical protein